MSPIDKNDFYNEFKDAPIDDDILEEITDDIVGDADDAVDGSIITEDAINNNTDQAIDSKPRESEDGFDELSELDELEPEADYEDIDYDTFDDIDNL